MKLNLANLDKISRAAKPAYARGALSAGIVHVGVGNFHRAHQAVYLDRLFNLGRDHDWAIVGAGVMPGDARLRDALMGQDLLSTVVEQSAETSSARITGAMMDFVPAADAAAIVARMAAPDIRIVSLTVTEGGYFINSATGAFDVDHPAIKADAAAPDAPRTVFGMILKALRARFDAGLAPFTVMSCDNLPGNGVVTKAAVVGLAELSDPGFARRVSDEVAFPNGMVDRITPATSDRERRIALEDYGIEDAWPVFCEDFSQWVLEDEFPCGRPALEEVGVEFVADVAPYEVMKLRILNGGHALIAYASALLDIVYAHEAMADPLVAAWLEKVERDEIIPVLPAAGDSDFWAYYQRAATRFANPKIADTIQRLCQDGSNRQPKFILPTTRERLARGEDVAGLALESALWRRYWEGASDSGAEIAADDPQAARLREKALATRERPADFLELGDIFGPLKDSPQFVGAFSTAAASLAKRGVRDTLRAYLDNSLR